MRRKFLFIEFKVELRWIEASPVDHRSPYPFIPAISSKYFTKATIPPLACCQS
jgi:hypothetical protein